MGCVNDDDGSESTVLVSADDDCNNCVSIVDIITLALATIVKSANQVVVVDGDRDGD